MKFFVWLVFLKIDCFRGFFGVVCFGGGLGVTFFILKLLFFVFIGVFMWFEVFL